VQWTRVELDLDGIRSPEDLAAAARAHGGAERLVSLALKGTAGFLLDAEALRAELSRDFLYLEVEDESMSLAPDALDRLAGERSIRGIFARRMLERLAAARTDTDRADTGAAVKEGLRALAEEGR
jgi:hypothetical protein